MMLPLKLGLKGNGRMKRIAIGLGLLAGLVAGAVAVVWFVPSVQDALVKRGMVQALSKAANVSFMRDKALHILLCGTGSPMPDLTRAGGCAAVIAGGRVAVIDAGPGSWAKLAAAGVPGGSIDTVLLTHLHSDPYRRSRRARHAELARGAQSAAQCLWAAGAAAVRARERR